MRAWTVAALAALGGPAATGPAFALEATPALVCAGAMQTLFQKPYTRLRTIVIEGNEAQVFRSPDGSYEVACYLQGDTVIWRTEKAPGFTRPRRWRTDPRDERVTWTAYHGMDLLVRVISPKNENDRITKLFLLEDLHKLVKLP